MSANIRRAADRQSKSNSSSPAKADGRSRFFFAALLPASSCQNGPDRSISMYHVRQASKYSSADWKCEQMAGASRTAGRPICRVARFKALKRPAFSCFTWHESKIANLYYFSARESQREERLKHDYRIEGVSLSRCMSRSGLLNSLI